MSPIDQIKNSIASNKIDKALNILSEIIESNSLEDYETPVTLFKGRLEDIDEKEMMQTMTSSEVRIEKNSLKAAILQFVKKIEPEIATNGDNENDRRKKLLDDLNEQLLYITEKIIYLEREKIQEINQSAKFDLGKKIEQLKEEKTQIEKSITDLSQV